MELFFYGIAAVLYVMVIHFAIAIKTEFDNMWWMLMYFAVGAVIGWYIESYTIGFIVGVVLSLILW